MSKDSTLSTALPSAAQSNPLQTTIGEHGPQGWDKLWQGKTTPWDRGAGNPFLIEILKSPPTSVRLPPAGSKALVPGCGTGYDVVSFAEVGGYEAWGADISPTAVNASKAWYASRPESSDSVKEGASVTFHELDFFEFGVPAGGFQIAFDLTFFCALPPAMHPAWGRRYSDILASPGALLITLCWPILDKPKGPPWGVSVSEYEEVLGAAFKKVHEGPGGENGRIAVWERQ